MCQRKLCKIRSSISGGWTRADCIANQDFTCDAAFKVQRTCRLTGPECRSHRNTSSYLSGSVRAEPSPRNVLRNATTTCSVCAWFELKTWENERKKRFGKEITSPLTDFDNFSSLPGSKPFRKRHYLNIFDKMKPFRMQRCIPPQP